MALPIEISPNPLISAAVELRFESDLKAEKLLPIFFPILSQEFPNLISNDLPRDIKKETPFQYASDYVFSNDQYSVGVGQNVIVFENVSGYALWSNYFPVIQKNLSKVFSGGFQYKFTRFGIRYISVLNGYNKINGTVKLNIDIPNVSGYQLSKQTYRTLLSKDLYTLQLQISEDAIAKKTTSEKKGLYIDIDISRINALPTKADKELFNIIDEMHLLEKELFYSLLTPEQLELLKPRY